MIMARILTFNTKGLGVPGKLDKILTWSTKLGIEILMLQETHTIKKTERDWENKWGGEKSITLMERLIKGG